MAKRTKLGRNDPCWCGSGKKFKRCHLGRDTDKPMEVQRFLDSFKKTFNSGYCMHPEAGAETCGGDIVKAHTIQRNGGLSRIAHDGHVFNCLMHGSDIGSVLHVDREPNLVGIGQASTFTGFCSKHDDALFAPIEKTPFVGSSEQVALLAYRAIARESFMKNADVSLTDTKRELDRGLPVSAQVAHQAVVTLHEAGVQKAVDEIKEIKANHDRMLQARDFDDLDFYIVGFEEEPEILSNGTSQATHDFRGRHIHELGQLDRPAHWLHFSLLATDTGGAAVFSWLREHRISEGFIDTLHELPDDELPDAVIRFAFEFLENTYFSPEWWAGLDKSVQMKLMQRQLRHIPPRFQFLRPDDCLRNDGISAVNWSVQFRSRAKQS